MAWSELRRLQQRVRRAARSLDRSNMIGRRYCAVCLTRLQWGERTTLRFCSNRCRQKAHRLRHSGKWPAWARLHALHQRCLDRLGMASRFEDDRTVFNALCAAPRAGLPGVNPEPMAERMIAAHREQKREAATERTLARVIRRVRAV